MAVFSSEKSLTTPEYTAKRYKRKDNAVIRIRACLKQCSRHHGDKCQKQLFVLCKPYRHKHHSHIQEQISQLPESKHYRKWQTNQLPDRKEQCHGKICQILIGNKQRISALLFHDLMIVLIHILPQLRELCLCVAIEIRSVCNLLR